MRRLIVIVLLGVIAASSALRADDAQSPVSVSANEDELARQLRIYREALLQGSSDEIRLDAATGLLLKQDSVGHEQLVSALGLSDNPRARRAVCRALIKSRAAGETVESLEVFWEPLLALLGDGGDTDLPRLAAEAMLVFKYEDIGTRLIELSSDTSLDKRIRANAIYALRIRPEPEALSDLIKLLDKSEAGVAEAAEAALQEAFGIPVGTSRQVWEQILGDLKQKGLNEIRRERLLRQEMRLREIEAERDQWQRLYLAALDKQYEGADEATRNAMILERMDSELAPIRLWALDKVERIPPNGQAVWREKLLALLGDDVRQIRLKTARVLNIMSALNPAETLLDRFGLEKDSEVALAMFEALGEAVFFAFSPGSKIELPGEVKLKTLEIGSTYMQSDDVDTAKKGAEIVRKLLELNNLSPEVAERYLAVLAERYKVSVQRNTPLRAELLGMMVRLSGRGPHRQKAAELYLPFFVEGVENSDNPSIRLAAASGLLQLDSANALKVFKQHNLMTTDNAALRRLVIDAAQQAGGPDDLEWLVEYLGANGLSEQTAKAFGAICRRADAQTVTQWADQLNKGGSYPELVYELLEVAEQKAITAKNEKLLGEIRIRRVAWYAQHQKAEQLVAYLETLKGGGASLLFPDAVASQLIALLAANGYHDTAIGLVGVRLERESLGKESQILVKLDEYFQSDKIEGEAKVAMFEGLSVLKSQSEAAVFQSRLKQWGQLLGIEIETKPASAAENKSN